MKTLTHEGKATLTPKQRVQTAIAHREPDRVPIDYAANPGIAGRLKQHFGLQPGDDEGLRRALGVDFRRTLEIMKPGGGYCFAPTHSLQDNSQTENVVAMYETARTAGVYS